MLDLKKDGTFLFQVVEGGAFDLPDNGGRIMPAAAGWSSGGYTLTTSIPAPDPEPGPPTIDDYKNAIVSMLDAKAQERRYENSTTIATYVNSTIPAWSAEATAYVAWRDDVWSYTYTELEKVMGGLRPQPTVEDFLTELPAMVWPA